MTVSSTLGARDKKDSLTRVPKKAAPAEPATPGEWASPPSPQPATEVEPFKPVKRGHYGEDMVSDDEKYEARVKRKGAEEAEARKIVARMDPLEQLGLDAGRCAKKVEEMRLLRADVEAAKQAVA